MTNTETANTATLRDLEDTVNANRYLSFDDYAALRAPAVEAVINDYAVNLVKAAKDAGDELTIDAAREMAKDAIPVAFVPEWMRNLRVSANVVGTEITYLEQLKQVLDGIAEMVSMFLDASGLFDAYVKKHAEDFKRMTAQNSEVVSNGDA